ncbi:MAG TPA: UTP--glucose-1-phosphate uridylyltransferase GalU [Candidatus Eisenbacteria bacterium]|jgi:UTP--glucose-1-phosphate uridylyltransferase|nr:UTP--glucose-1-phosphate uridylyltransferase GalU [Candidatus Eisenbacteria bacterium]
MKLRKAVIPVAGLGTRFLPATKTVPKELLPIVDVPSIQYVVQEAVDAGIEEIIFVTGRGKDGIEDHFDEAPELEQVLADRGNDEMVKVLRRIAEMTEVVSVRQKKPLGLGHAVLCARDLVGNEPFAVMLADDLIDSATPCIRQLLDIFQSTNESVIALMEVPQTEVHQYGVIKGKVMKERLYEVEGMVEKPPAKDAPSRMAIIGRYVLRPEIFSILQNLPSGKGGEIQLTDGLAHLLRERKIYGCEFSGDRYDIGDKFGFVRATVAYALKRPDLRDKVLEYLKSAKY